METNDIPQPVVKKKRRTVDERLGFNGLIGIAIVGSLFQGGFFEIISFVCGLTAISFIYRDRKKPEVSKQIRLIRWGLVLLWVVLVVMVV